MALGRGAGVCRLLKISVLPLAVMATLSFVRCSSVGIAPALRRPSSDTVAFAPAAIERLAQQELARVYSSPKTERPVPSFASAEALAETILLRPDFNLDENSLFPLAITQTLKIENLDDLKLVDGVPQSVVTMDRTRYQVNVELENSVKPSESVPVRTDYDDPSSAQPDPQTEHLRTKVQCDRPFSIIRSMGSAWRDITSKEFTVYHAGNLQKAYLKLPSGEVTCDLLFRREKEKQYRAGIRLTTVGSLATAGLSGKLREVCVYDQTNKKATPLDMFHNSSESGLGCVAAAESAELLVEPIESFNKKIAALTGSVLPEEVIRTQNFDYPIDFSKAPRFDAIVLTTMEYKNDFYGNTLAKIFKWHAARGASVKIVVPGASTRFFSGDLAILGEMQAFSSNITVQLYRDVVSNPVGLNRQHRVMHAKILAAVSSAAPENDFFIIGGRNVKDTFLYYTAPNYKKRPQLEQYGTMLSPFSFFDDMEMLVRGQTATAQVVAQFMSFWNRDRNTMRMRPIGVHLPLASLPTPSKKLEGPLIRSMVSIPYVDGRQLESVVVEVIRSARKTLRIVSPYFRPTAAIGAALRDAASRGVKIQFITELNLIKDNSPPITMGVNTHSVNLYRKSIEVYLAKDDHAILHSKVILADDDVLFISGANMNMRSFIHDVEAGLLVADAKIAARFKDVFDNVYVKQAQLVTGRLHESWTDRLFIPIVDEYF